eukprot:jgi/Chrzof1/5939/Cz16g21090.t1
MQQGPGSYNTDAPPRRCAVAPDGQLVWQQGANAVSQSVAGSSSFATKVPREHQKEPTDYERTPGPGAYIRPQSAPPGHSSSISSSSRKFPAHRQLFGRSPGRSYGSSGGCSSTPGPGTYALDRYGSLTATLKPEAAAESPFLTTTARFQSSATDAPGPGNYMADQVLSLSGDISRKLASRRGAFGSAAPRAVGASAAVAAAAVAVPSPSHDSNSVTAAHAASAVPVKDSDRASSAFASTSDRFRSATAPIAAPDYSSWDGCSVLPGDAAGLGPGSYELMADWSRGRPVSAGSTPNRHVSYRSSAFLSDTNRFSSGVGSSLVSRQQLETPGPGKQL